jgi:hypothetical protein
LNTSANLRNDSVVELDGLVNLQNTTSHCITNPESLTRKLIFYPGDQIMIRERKTMRMSHCRNLNFSEIKSIESLNQDFLGRIHRAFHNQDPAVKKALESKEKVWEVTSDKLVVWKDCIYVPIDRKLQEEIIHEFHDTPLAGHPGRYKTQELITRNYWWPRMQSQIHQYVDGCEI